MTLGQVLKEHFGVQEESLAAFLNGKLDYDFLIKNNFFPLKVDHDSKTLYAVTSDPLNYSVSDYVVKAIRYNIHLSLAPESTVKELSKSHSPGQPGSAFVSL